MISEITEEADDSLCFISTEDQKRRIRQILDHQKSLYWSSSSSPSILSSSAASCSSFSSSHKSSSLLDLMKVGSASLRRLFDMEHTSLATHFQDYSGSPIIKPIPLWGSDVDDEIHDPWASIIQNNTCHDLESDGPSRLASDGFRVKDDDDVNFKDKKAKISRRRLTRKKSFRRLPGFCLWRFRKHRTRLRLKRFRIMICGTIS